MQWLRAHRASTRIGARLGAGVVLAIVAMLAVACRSRPVAGASEDCPPDALRSVELLGQHLRRVSILAPDSVASRELEREYGALVTDSLLNRWREHPASAPGREVLNPWPARIDIESSGLVRGGCQVRGSIIYVTTDDTATVAERRPVTVEVRDGGGWRISALRFEQPRGEPSSAGDSSGASPPATRQAGVGQRAERGGGSALPQPPALAALADSQASSRDEPADVFRRYYAAITARRFADAHGLWARKGEASGQTLAQFSAGFAGTRSVRVTVTGSAQIEGAAGSQYATVPVRIDATTTGGEPQAFSGRYTLRRSMVDGATAEQRSWRIERAELRSIRIPR